MKKQVKTSILKTVAELNEVLERAKSKTLDINSLRDGEPCSHPGCLSHVTHPCEHCGRIAGKTIIDEQKGNKP